MGLPGTLSDTTKALSADGYALFLFKYEKNRWWHSSQSNQEWTPLSAEGVSASFVGDGRWHDLGNEWDYQFSSDTTKALLQTDLEACFLYKYHKNQWWSRTRLEPTRSSLSVEGVNASFVADGEWHLLGSINGASWQYRYDTYYRSGDDKPCGDGIWQRFAHGVWSDRFLYDYSSGSGISRRRLTPGAYSIGSGSD